MFVQQTKRAFRKALKRILDFSYVICDFIVSYKLSRLIERFLEIFGFLIHSHSRQRMLCLKSHNTWQIA